MIKMEDVAGVVERASYAVREPLIYVEIFFSSEVKDILTMVYHRLLHGKRYTVIKFLDKENELNEYAVLTLQGYYDWFEFITDNYVEGILVPSNYFENTRKNNFKTEKAIQILEKHG